VLGQHLEQALVVLLGGVEISVDERTTVVVSPAVDGLGIFACPPFEAALLLVAQSTLLTVFGNYSWLEVIIQREDDVYGAVG
jgi:hypothetical protein